MIVYYQTYGTGGGLILFKVNNINFWVTYTICILITLH